MFDITRYKLWASVNSKINGRLQKADMNQTHQLNCLGILPRYFKFGAAHAEKLRFSRSTINLGAHHQKNFTYFLPVKLLKSKTR